MTKAKAMATNDHAQAAAEWLAIQTEIPHPIIPHLRERFDLSMQGACEAVRRAADIRQERKA